MKTETVDGTLRRWRRNTNASVLKNALSLLPRIKLGIQWVDDNPNFAKWQKGESLNMRLTLRITEAF